LGTYVPILSNKQAELHSLADIPAPDRESMLPLIVVRDPRPPRGRKSERPRPWSPETHLRRAASHENDGLVGCLGSDRILLDISQVDRNILESGEHPAAWLLRYCRDLGMTTVPVIGAHGDGEYRRAIAGATRVLHTGACIRVRRDDLVAGAEGLRSLLRDLDLPRAEIDLVVDLEALAVDRARFMADVVRKALEGFRPLNGWRSVSLCAGAFPMVLADVLDHDSEGSFSRTDYAMWRHACADLGECDLQFGDYGPVTPSDDAGGGLGAANLRFARPTHWRVLRGLAPEDKTPVPEDHNRLGRLLIESTADFDPLHCAGCEFIAKKAYNGGGNAKQWRQADFGHHFATVREHLKSAA